MSEKLIRDGKETLLSNNVLYDGEDLYFATETYFVSYNIKKEQN